MVGNKHYLLVTTLNLLHSYLASENSSTWKTPNLSGNREDTWPYWKYLSPKLPLSDSSSCFWTFYCSISFCSISSPSRPSLRSPRQYREQGEQAGGNQTSAICSCTAQLPLPQGGEAGSHPSPSDPFSCPVTEDCPVPGFLLLTFFLTQLPLFKSNQVRTSFYIENLLTPWRNTLTWSCWTFSPPPHSIALALGLAFHTQKAHEYVTWK